MEAILTKLTSLGVSLSVEDDQLILDVPEGVESDEFLPDVKRHKEGLIRHLRLRPEKSFDLVKPQQCNNASSYPTFYQQKKEYMRYLLRGNHAFNLNFAVTTEFFDDAVFNQSLRLLYQRHESLRTRLSCDQGEMRQVVYPIDEIVLPMKRVDLRHEKDKYKEAQRLWKEATNRKFDFANELLSEILVAQLDDNVTAISMTVHHAVADGKSVSLLQQELFTIYDSLRNKRPVSLVTQQFQYKDYAAWVNQYLDKAGSQCRDFYAATIMENLALEKIPVAPMRSYQETLRHELTLNGKNVSTYDSPFGLIVNLFPPVGATFLTSFSATARERVYENVKHFTVTPFEVLVSAFVLAYGEHQQTQAARISIPFSTRVHAGFEGIVGWLTNEVIVCFSMTAPVTTEHFLKGNARRIAEAAEHRIYPHERILNDLNLPLSVVAPVLFNLINCDQEIMEPVADAHHENGSGHFNLHIQIMEYKNGFRLRVNYNTAAFTSAAVERLISCFRDKLSVVVPDNANKLLFS
jgi:hypothetical protein